MRRRLLRLLAVTLPCLLVAGVVRADEPTGKAASTAEDAELLKFRRDKLIEDAKQSLGTGEFKASDSKALRRALRDDALFLETAPSASDADQQLLDKLGRTVHHRRVFLGISEDDPATDVDVDEAGDEGEGAHAQRFHGALSQAHALLRWLRGVEACGVWIRVRRGDEIEREAAYSFPVPPPPPPAPPPAPEPKEEAPEEKPEEKEETKEPDAPAGPPGEEKPPPGKADDAKKEEKEAPPPAVSEPVVRDRPVDDQPKSWVEWVVAKEGGRLLGKSIEAEVCSAATDLLEVTRERPDYLPDAGMFLKRYAIATDEDHVFSYNRPYLWLVHVLSTQRVEALSKEAPTRLLTDESTVREKARRAETYEKRAEALREEQDRITERLHDIAKEIQDWRGIAAALSGEIQTEKQRMEEAARPSAEREGDENGEEGDEEAETKALPRSLKLRLLEAQESTVSMELRLLYHTVLRATERQEIVKSLLDRAEAEARITKDIYERFAGELAHSRSRRQLSRLRMQALELTERREELEAKEERTARQDLRIEAYGAIVALNEIVQGVVERRGRLSRITSAADRAEEAALPQAAKEDAPPEPGKKPEDNASDAVTLTGPRLRMATQHPEVAGWGLDVIDLFKQDLENPDLQGQFDSGLVAKHYEVATDRANILRAGLLEAGDDAQLRSVYAAGLARVEAALGALEKQRDFIGLHTGPSWVKELERDFDFAIHNLALERVRFQKLLDATLAYREGLLDKGKRSLAIRVEGDVDPEVLLLALEESIDGVKSAGRWFSGETDPDVWDFLSQRWGRVLLLLLSCILVVLAVFFTRRGIDRWLDAKAAKTAGLRWEGASVRDERRAALAREALERQAREQAEEALKAQTQMPPPIERIEPPEAVDPTAADDLKPEEGRGS